MANIFTQLLQWLRGQGAQRSSQEGLHTPDHEATRYTTYPSLEAIEQTERVENISAESLLSLAKQCMNPKRPPVDYDTALYYAEVAAERGSREGIELVIQLLEGSHGAPSLLATHPCTDEPGERTVGAHLGGTLIPLGSSPYPLPLTLKRGTPT